MPDIRNFFAAKGGAPPKPAPKPAEDAAKIKRSKRKVIEDSEDEEPAEKKKPIARAAAEKKSDDKPKGVDVTTDDYFASPKASKASPKKKDIKTEVPVRSSPRNKDSNAKKGATTGNGTPTKRRATSAHKDYKDDAEEDAYLEDGDEDGDDVYAANVKGRNKRKNDDYEESGSEEELPPKPKRAAGRGQSQAVGKAEDDEKGSKVAKSTTSTKKRKSPELESDESEEDLPRKKPTAAKTRALRAKKDPEPEDAGYQNILNNISTVRAPTPPPKDSNAKFDWRKANTGGGNSAVAPPGGVAEIPEGEEECLSGLTFVFTGVLQTIGRDEAAALVKKYGGKVTGSPSSKTSFVVLGEDAGPNKLAKIKDHGIKTIDESGLFELIRKLPAFGGSGAGAQKAQEKKKAQEEKIKQQAAEMEAEEKAKRAADIEAAKKAAAARGMPNSQPSKSSIDVSTQLLTSKYAPTQLSHICGNKIQVERIQKWLRGWPKAKKYNFQKRGADGLGGERAIIISGPPGIGKTTSAHLAAKMEGYDILESNASDTRSKKLVEASLTDTMNNTSLLGFFGGDGKSVDVKKKKIVLIMDEVDGMSAGDRGGVGALAKLCRKTEVPLILICNDRRLPKMKPFDHATFDIKFQRPTVDQVRARIMTICHREGLKLPPPVIDALIEGSNKDIRQIINMIATTKLDQTSMDFNQGKAMSKAWEKHVVLKPWDICQKMLGGGLFAPASKATLNDKIELYFNDHEFSFLMIQENYLRTKPAALTGKNYSQREHKLRTLELFDQAASSISDGDLVDRMIHGPQQHWSLMPTHAIFSTVRPASLIAGQLLGSGFTSWLGNHAKTGKLKRFTREIHSHMRLRSSGDHNEIRQEYLPILWDRTVNRMQNEGPEAVSEVIEMMDSYFLTRDDFDAIQELGIGYMDGEKVQIDSKAKATFTRKYNSMRHPVPYMKATNVVAPKKPTKDVPDLEEAIEEEDDGIEEAVEMDDDEIDLKKDKYIKQPKAKKATKKKATDDNADEAQPKTKAKGKSAAKSKAKGEK